MKLATAEDRFHVHKLLGIYALLHFLARYACFLSGSDDMGFGAFLSIYASIQCKHSTTHTRWLS